MLTVPGIVPLFFSECTFETPDGIPYLAIHFNETFRKHRSETFGIISYFDYFFNPLPQLKTTGLELQEMLP